MWCNFSSKVRLGFSGRTIQLDGVADWIGKAEAKRWAIQVSGRGVEVAFSREQVKELVTDPRPEGRVEIESTAVVYFGNDHCQLQIRNLSTSGAALISDSKLPEESFVRMVFRVTESSHPIEINGILVRSEETEDGILIAMRFLDPPNSFIARIEELIHNQEENSTEGVDLE